MRTLAFVNALLTTLTFAADTHRSFQEMAFENGFSAEQYTVVTDDGYVSQLYRIPGKFGEKGNGKPAVLMMHGMECDMNFWTVNDADKVPPFILAE